MVDKSQGLPRLSAGGPNNSSSTPRRHTMQPSAELLSSPYQHQGPIAPRTNALLGSGLADPVQLTRQSESQRSRLALGSRLLSSRPNDDAGEEHAFDHSDPATSIKVLAPRTLVGQHESSTRGRARSNAGALDAPAQNALGALQSHAFSQIKPAKSLRQRLNPEQSQEPVSRTVTGVSSPGLRPAAFSTYQHDILRPHAPSRSVSVLSSVHGRLEDDISSVMMRGATDLRNAKFEVEELRREIVFLHAQVSSVTKEKDELSQRLKAVKEAAKQSLQSSSKSLEALRTTINELKSQSETSFGVMSEVRTSLVNVQEIRSSVSMTIKSIEPYVEPNEKWAKSAEMKSVLNTLEVECSKSQQVADLLRDRLQSIGGELVEAKNRIMELESAQGDDRAAICKANATILSTTEEIAGLATCLKKQQSELHSALVAAADVEAKLASAHGRIVELQELVNQKDTELLALRAVQHENEKLREVVEEKNTCISSLRDLETDIAQLKAAIVERDMEFAALTATNAEKDVRASEDNARAHRFENAVAEANTTIQQLRSELGASDAHRQDVIKDNERLLSERRLLQDKYDDLDSTLSRARKEIETSSVKLQQANLRYQALEERFEDQSVTLRITRESAGDTQERLLAAETLHGKALAGITAQLERETSILKEQKLGLQTTMDVMSAALRRQEESLVVIQEEHVDRLRQQEAILSARLETEEKHLKQLTDDLAEARTRIAVAESRSTASEDEIRELRTQLQQAQLPRPEIEVEMRALRSRVSTLEAAEMKSALRAKTIDARYRVGDLNDEEKAFINTLISTSQAIHEQELVANRNELRRRDNALKEMRSKVHLLESTLAKHLSALKAKSASVVAPTDNHSMIDPTAWMSSGQSSSPVQAPDRDGQPTTVDVPVPTKPSPALGRTIPVMTAPESRVLLPLDTPARQTPALPDPTTFSRKKSLMATPNKRFDKPNFSRLATDCSDEILDFDDDVATVRKPTPPSSLGKRKPSSPPKPMEEPGAPKPFKRLRATRKAEAQENNNGAVVKPLQPAASKKNSRRRR